MKKMKVWSTVLATGVALTTLAACSGGSNSTTASSSEEKADKSQELVIYSNSVSNGRGDWLTAKAKEAGFNIKMVDIPGAQLADRVIAEKNNAVADMVFGIGPAGTGKTFVAVVMAVQALKKGQVKKIILTRPAVEAGENLGFLPGDLKEKVDPYLRPIYDALYAIYGVEHTNRLLERGVIEVAPLAYMRGRTLEEAFIILDEAQNTTRAQMKMFLTRLGFGSKMIINGDKTQVDLPKGSHMSGLVDAENKLKGISGISFVEFDAFDVVRHPLVSSIIDAYSEQGE